MDIEINRKRSETITFQYYEADGTTTRPLTGCTVFFTVKPNISDDDADDSDAIIKKTITSHTTPATGLTTIELSYTDTNVPPANYFYDISVLESDGKLYQAQSGRCRVDATTGNRII